jgi:hypothetical protein
LDQNKTFLNQNTVVLNQNKTSLEQNTVVMVQNTTSLNQNKTFLGEKIGEVIASLAKMGRPPAI